MKFQEIKTNDKSFYDGVAATALYHVMFEVFVSLSPSLSLSLFLFPPSISF